MAKQADVLMLLGREVDKVAGRLDDGTDGCLFSLHAVVDVIMYEVCY